MHKKHNEWAVRLHLSQKESNSRVKMCILNSVTGMDVFPARKNIELYFFL